MSLGSATLGSGVPLGASSDPGGAAIAVTFNIGSVEVFGTAVIDVIFDIGKVAAYAEQLPLNTIDVTFDIGTVEAVLGSVIEIPFSIGTVAAQVSNYNVAVIGSTFTIGEVSAVVSVGNLANIAVPFSLGVVNALGGGYVNTTFNIGTVSAATTVGNVANVEVSFSIGTVAIAGTSPNTINIAIPFSIGTFTNNDIAITFNIGTVLARGGFAEDTSIAYCINATTGALTRYTNFGFKRIVRINNKYYGLKADGLYLLEGATDNGTTIDARARTGMFHANDYHIKRIQYAYLRENHFATSIGVTADDNDFYATYTYLSAFNGKRVKFAMGVSGIYWDFEFSNVSGGGLNIGAVEFRTDITSRKV